MHARIHRGNYAGPHRDIHVYDDHNIHICNCIHVYIHLHKLNNDNSKLYILEWVGCKNYIRIDLSEKNIWIRSWRLYSRGKPLLGSSSSLMIEGALRTGRWWEAVYNSQL